MRFPTSQMLTILVAAGAPPPAQGAVPALRPRQFRRAGRGARLRTCARVSHASHAQAAPRGTSLLSLLTPCWCLPPLAAHRRATGIASPARSRPAACGGGAAAASVDASAASTPRTACLRGILVRPPLTSGPVAVGLAGKRHLSGAPSRRLTNTSGNLISRQWRRGALR
jgi:hypothetical protein